MKTRLIPLLALLALAACNEDKGSNERRTIVAEDQEVVLRVFRDDLRRGVVGVRRAAAVMDRGFLVEDAAQREREMRTVMRAIQQPGPRAIEELMVSATSFLAAVDTGGEVIARDVRRDDDRMRGFDMAEVSGLVRRALAEGESGYELIELPSSLETDPPSVTVLFVAPARHEGRVVGAMVSGLPLWRLSQQLSNQLQLENAPERRRGAQIWALVYRGDVLHWHHGFPEGLRELAPDAAARARGLASSPGGYTGEVYQYGRWYGYGVLPLPRLGEDVGVILFRSDADHPAQEPDEERAEGSS